MPSAVKEPRLVSAHAASLCESGIFSCPAVVQDLSSRHSLPRYARIDAERLKKRSEAVKCKSAVLFAGAIEAAT